MRQSVLSEAQLVEHVHSPLEQTPDPPQALPVRFAVITHVRVAVLQAHVLQSLLRAVQLVLQVGLRQVDPSAATVCSSSSRSSSTPCSKSYKETW